MARRTRKINPGLVHGFRSGLEGKISEQIKAHGHNPRYEEIAIDYVVPAREARYTPDFMLDNDIIVETKGRFVTADRKKHQLIQEQHPNLDIRFVFSNSNGKLYKGSKTTYGEWCRRNRFTYADKEIPREWFLESRGTSKGNGKASARKAT